MVTHGGRSETRRHRRHQPSTGRQPARGWGPAYQPGPRYQPESVSHIASSSHRQPIPQLAGEHRGLVAQIRIELMVAEARRRSSQCRVGKVDAARLRQYGRVGAVSCSPATGTPQARCTASLGEALKQLLVRRQQTTRPRRDVLVLAHPLDLSDRVPRSGETVLDAVARELSEQITVGVRSALTAFRW